MAITYPTTLDVFTNPVASDLLTSPDHATQHANINDAVEALEAKVAIGNTVLGTYTAYTPTFTNLTVGNGTLAAQYCTVNKFVHTFGSLTFGSTTAFTGTALFSLPVVTVAAEMGATGMAFGFATYINSATSSVVKGTANAYGSTTNLVLWVATTSGTYEGQTNPTASIPHTWATGDIIRWNIMYKAA